MEADVHVHRSDHDHPLTTAPSTPKHPTQDRTKGKAIMATYKENDDFVPNPTDATGTVNTTRTGVPHNLDLAGSVFVQDRVETAQAIVDGRRTSTTPRVRTTSRARRTRPRTRPRASWTSTATSSRATRPRRRRRRRRSPRSVPTPPRRPSSRTSPTPTSTTSPPRTCPPPSRVRPPGRRLTRRTDRHLQHRAERRGTRQPGPRRSASHLSEGEMIVTKGWRVVTNKETP